METHISKSTLLLLCMISFVLGFGGYLGVHAVNGSDDSSQETQSDNETGQQDDSNHSVILEREQQQVEQEEIISTSGDYLLPDSAINQYSYSELATLDNYQLYIARNEIYARHGRTFRNPDLNNYFAQKSWYVPVYGPDEFDQLGLLNAAERHNADTMLEIEKSRNSPYLK